VARSPELLPLHGLNANTTIIKFLSYNAKPINAPRYNEITMTHAE